MDSHRSPLERLVMGLAAWWRLLWGCCPKCNSDAPEIDDCSVCEGYRTPYPPSAQTKARWAQRLNDGA